MVTIQRNKSRAGATWMRSVAVRATSAALLAGTALVWAAGSQAQMVSPQMIEQLKSMPRAQQEMLARQYGIDLSAISGLGGSSKPAQLAMPGTPLVPGQGEDNFGFDFGQQPLWLEEQEEPEVERFGRSLFDREVSTFAPTDDASVPDDYRLGVGDELSVQLYGKESESYNLQVGRDGDINFPKLGSIRVAGLTYEAARDLINSRVAEQLLGVESVVSLGRLRAIGIFIAGEVNVPGAYSVSAMTTVTQALFQAGGISELGALRNISIKRGDQAVANFDAYQLLLAGDASGDVRLRSGDVLFVPPYNAAAEVQGEIKRPMIYEVRAGETVADLVAMAGGFSRNAFRSTATLTRLDVTQGLPVTTNINLQEPADLALEIADGDVLRVFKTGDALKNAVTVKGSVYRDGVFGWREGLRVSDLFGNAERDFPPSTDLQYSLIVSTTNELLDISLSQFSLAKAIAAPGSAADPLLSPRDELLVFSLPSLDDNDDEQEQPRDTERSRWQPQQRSVDGGAAGQYRSDDQRQQLVAGSNSGGQREAQFADNSGRQAGRDESRLASQAWQQRNSQRGDVYDDERRSALSKEDAEALAFREGASRQELLAPVIDKLKRQARRGEPVQLVSISGAVVAPGTYPLFEGTTPETLIMAAGGLKDSAYIESAELRRIGQVSAGQVSADYSEIDLEALLAGEFTVQLQSRDHLAIRDIPDWNPVDAVVVEGEVMFPGTYLIQKGETISSVIARAGGPTGNAFLEGTVFTREDIAKMESDRAKAFAKAIQQTFATSLLTEEANKSSMEEVFAVASQLESFEGMGRLMIDLPGALNGDRELNIQLVDGDKIVIPKTTNTVTVVGEVNQQGTHLYSGDLSMDAYLGLSAGLTARADDKAIYVVKANGAVRPLDAGWWRFGSGTQLAPGDTIVVPVDSSYKESLVAWRDITQIIYQGVVAIAAITSL